MKEGIVTRIRTVMTHYGLTVSTLADTIGVQRSSISHLLSGRNKPSLDFVMKLVQTYTEVSLYWLLYGEGHFPTTEELPTTPPLRTPYEKEEETFLPKRELPRVETSKSSTKQPVRIVLLYSDGTFESFAVKND